MQKHAYGYKKSKVDYRDFRFIATEMALPPMVDLRKLCSPIRDQGQRGTCTCEALGGLLEFGHKPKITASVLFPYYNSGVIEGSTDDTGREPRDVLKSAVKDGVCLSRYWPYSRSIGAKPSTSAYAHAILHITSYHALAGLQDIKAWLVTHQKPVYLGFTVYSSFESDEVAKTGIMPLPQPGEEVLGGHMIDLVGYDDSKQWFYARNSWGKGWGNRGNFYMPYPFVTPANVSDIWGVVPAGG